MTDADPFTDHPFGTSISSADIIETMMFFDDWEERYRYLIDLGRELPELPAALYTDEARVKGCQSQVWLVYRREGQRLQFAADSDAIIVKGLLAVILAACNNHTPEEILAADTEAFGLPSIEGIMMVTPGTSILRVSHLSPTRGNGLRAIVARVRQIAESA